MSLLRWRIGDVTVTRVVEMATLVSARHSILPGLTPEAMAPFEWLRPDFIDDRGRLKMSVHALVIEAPGRRIVVDTCIGNDKSGRDSDYFNGLDLPFLEEMYAAGFDPDSIDTVLCTHLHVDHVGWNTRLVDGVWVPTFPNARYLIGAREFAYWRDQRDDESQRAVFADSIVPVLDAGVVDLVEDTHRICDEVRLVPTPGHSPGHVCVQIDSLGKSALITGDFMHHPAQMALPHCGSTFDHDGVVARQTRERMLRQLASSPTLVIGTHFAAPTAGRVVSDGDGWRLDTVWEEHACGS